LIVGLNNSKQPKDVRFNNTVRSKLRLMKESNFDVSEYREFYSGITLKYNKNGRNQYIKPGENITIDVNLFIGIIAGYVFYNGDNNINISGDIEIILSDVNRNKKTYN